MRTASSNAALSRLKAATENLHAAAERHVRILDADATDTVYVRYLARMHGFHAPLEHQLAAHAGLEAAGFAAGQRAKREMLAADLATFGVTVAELPRCTELPALGDVTRAAGVAYVIEGSTLGGRFILSHMKVALGHLIGRATRFLAGYGEHTGPMWKQFAALCDRVLFDEAAIQAAVGGARDTFATLVTWLDEPALDPPHPYLRRRPREARS